MERQMHLHPVLQATGRSKSSGKRVSSAHKLLCRFPPRGPRQAPNLASLSKERIVVTAPSQSTPSFDSFDRKDRDTPLTSDRRSVARTQSSWQNYRTGQKNRTRDRHQGHLGLVGTTSGQACQGHSPESI